MSMSMRFFCEPPNSYLCVIYPIERTEREVWEAFDKFGNIEIVWIINDKRTNEDGGILYIKFAKTSEAMKAMQEMDCTTLPGTNTDLKVFVPKTKPYYFTQDPIGDERLIRLFVNIPKNFKEQDLRNKFSTYGDIHSIKILRDRSSGENSGFGYVLFCKPVDAAMAYENCNPSFKPKFPEPEDPGDDRD